MNEQNQSTQPAVQTNKRPVPVTIIATLAIVGSLAMMLFVTTLFASSWSEIFNSFVNTSFKDSVPFYKIIFPYLAFIILGIGLLNMKKWAIYGWFVIILYIFLQSLTVAIPSLISGNLSGFNLILPIIYASLMSLTNLAWYIAIFIYLWIIRKQFN